MERPFATGLIIECICFWAVPIFLMLTGATLMRYREKYDTKTFYRKRITKVLIPLLIWSVIIAVWKYKTSQIRIDNFSIKYFLNLFFQNKIESIYYFMFLIIGIYITIPVLSVLAEEKNKKICWYAVLALFITQSVLPVMFEIFGIKYSPYLEIQFGGYIIFILLGYLLSTTNIEKKYRVLLYIAAIFSICLRYFTTLNLTISENKLNKLFFEYVQFHSVILASAVFVFMKNINMDRIKNSLKMSKIVSEISGCSFGIYLIHKVVMHYEIKFLNISVITWQWRVFGIISTYLISLTIVYLVKKIPIVKKIFP